MAYTNPRYSKRNVVAARVNDDLFELIKERADRRRTQPATLIHDLIEAALRQEEVLDQLIGSARA